MAKSKLVKANQKIAEEVVGGYKKIEETVVGGYKKIESGFVDQFLTKEGESVEDAKKRLAAEQTERKSQMRGSICRHWQWEPGRSAKVGGCE